jgi:pimeloyl-ACP methyl ester carboxylesterase
MNSREISFTVDQEKINGHLVIPNEGGDRKPGIIFIHGMTSSEKGYLQLANDCAHKWIVWLTINLRWHEGSDGNFQTLTVRDLTNDGVAAYDFLARQEGIDTDRISICGTSVGAHVAMMVSAQRKVESLILRAPALYTEEMLGMTITEIMQWEGGLFHGITSLENTEALEIIKTFFRFCSARSIWEWPDYSSNYSWYNLPIRTKCKRKRNDYNPRSYPRLNRWGMENSMD